MNERIRLLARQSGALPTQDCGVPQWYIDEDVFEKFAQLIVRECAGIVEDAVDHREPASTYVDKIKKHFGHLRLDD